MKPLEGITIVDFSQFLSGPSASLRMADLGARVIKIERPGIGDICRQLYVSDVMIEGESTIFHAINRNKESFAADLKNEEDLLKVKQLLLHADVLIHNFRPGVMERLGLDYASVQNINPQLVYAVVSGYGAEGPWKDLPGQDLLLQAVSGVTWLTNNRYDEPTPMGVAVVDILAGSHLTQGILAALYQRITDGVGALVEVSMLESILDFQFELISCFYNDGNKLPVRSAINNGNAYVAAPYGIYKTKDSFLALAMVDIITLKNLLNCEALGIYTNSAEWYMKRDEIKQIIADHLLSATTEHWLSVLQPADVWCAKVLDYHQLMQEAGYLVLNMEQEVKTSNGLTIKTLRCPIRMDGNVFVSDKGSPLLGEHTAEIEKEFNLAVERVAH